MSFEISNPSSLALVSATLYLKIAITTVVHIIARAKISCRTVMLVLNMKKSKANAYTTPV